MGKEDFVSLEVAKLLKEKGYNELCNSSYFLHDENWLSAPTLYDAQKWLRTKHNIHINVDVNASGWYYSLCKADNSTFIYASYESGPNEGGCWDSYEECLNDALLKGVKRV